MPSIARDGDVCSGHPSGPPRPPTSYSSNVFINGKKAVRESDTYALHGTPLHGGSVTSGSGTVKVNGLGVARNGDPISCGSTVANGSPDVIAGG